MLLISSCQSPLNKNQEPQKRSQHTVVDYQGESWFAAFRQEQFIPSAALLVQYVKY